MFNEAYKYHSLGRNKMYQTGHLYRHVYKFKTERRRHYLVWVDLHEYDTYVVKFFLQKDEKSNNKFNTLVGDHNATRVINTSINIMFDILKSNDKASFAFTGAQTEQEEANNIALTKRFKIYELLMKSKFGLVNFSHITAPQKSAYLMYNLKNSSTTPQQIIQMITNIYPELDE